MLSASKCGPSARLLLLIIMKAFVKFKPLSIAHIATYIRSWIELGVTLMISFIKIIQFECFYRETNLIPSKVKKSVDPSVISPFL